MSHPDNQSSHDFLPLGKLPPQLLARALARLPAPDSRVLLGPGVGLDCAVVDMGGELLVCKSDPVTFVSARAGHYLVQVNANDIATTGATPRWLLATLLLPEGRTTEASAEALLDEISESCRAQEISLIGGHTEITHGLERPIVVGALLGTVAREALVTPKGARPGDRVLLTKSVPIEGTAILARERPERLRGVLSADELQAAQGFLFDPGISVVRDARLALAAATVTAMHDPTEGGLAAALWELAQASGRSLVVDLARVPVAALSARVCAAFGIDPLETIASGALLITVPADEAAQAREALRADGIACAEIGEVRDGPPEVRRRKGGGEVTLPWPARDGVARALEVAPQP